MEQNYSQAYLKQTVLFDSYFGRYHFYRITLHQLFHAMNSKLALPCDCNCCLFEKYFFSLPKQYVYNQAVSIQ